MEFKLLRLKESPNYMHVYMCLSEDPILDSGMTIHAGEFPEGIVA